MNEGSRRKDSDLIDLLLKDRLVHDIAIIEVTPCLSDSERIKFLAQVDRPLSEVLEILYLYIAGSNYSEALGSLTYKRQRKSCMTAPSCVSLNTQTSLQLSQEWSSRQDCKSELPVFRSAY